MSRRSRILVGLLALLGLSLVPVWGPPQLESGAYLQDVRTGEAVVACTTAAPRALGLVIRSGTDVVFELAAGEPATRHELRARGLAPGTAYEFELRDAGGGVYDRGTLVTRSDRDDRPLRLAITGDSGGLPWWIGLRGSTLFRLLDAERWLPVDSDPRSVAALLQQATPEFWLHVGDVVYPAGEREDYFAGFFAPFGRLLHHSPVYPVLGNHDLMTEDGAPFFETFVLPEDGMGERCFTFRDGPLRVIGLDFSTAVGPDHPSLAFLRRVAEASTEPWLLVFNHYPVRSVYRDNPRRDLQEHFAPLCRELGVDMMCAGHDHNYQRYGQPGETIEIVSGGGGKSLYEVKYHPDGLVVAESVYHASFVEIDGAVLRFTARAVDGRVLDEFTVDKGALLREGRARGSPARLERIRALVR